MVKRDTLLNQLIYFNLTGFIVDNGLVALPVYKLNGSYIMERHLAIIYTLMSLLTYSIGYITRGSFIGRRNQNTLVGLDSVMLGVGHW